MLRVAACYACKEVPGLDVPDQYRDAVRRRTESVQDPDSYKAWAPDVLLEVGDCRALMGKLSNVQLFLSDPPYNIGFEYGGVDDDLPWPEYAALMQDVARLSFRAAAVGGSFLVIHYPETMARLMPFFEAAGWRFNQWCSWVYKSRRGATGRRFSRSHRAAVWFSKGASPFFQDADGVRALDWIECEQVRGGSIGWQGYGCQVPAKVLRHFISHLSQPGDLVADPFLGTGSTAKEAVFLGRRAWGCDLNPEAAALWAPLRATAAVDGLQSVHGPNRAVDGQILSIEARQTVLDDGEPVSAGPGVSGPAGGRIGPVPGVEAVRISTSSGPDIGGT
jgi:site-specific DNA-methyltransferase (adenine-specific)